jgi:hypothetical protein
VGRSIGSSAGGEGRPVPAGNHAGGNPSKDPLGCRQRVKHNMLDRQLDRPSQLAQFAGSRQLLLTTVVPTDMRGLATAVQLECRKLVVWCLRFAEMRAGLDSQQVVFPAGVPRSAPRPSPTSQFRKELSLGRLRQDHKPSQARHRRGVRRLSSGRHTHRVAAATEVALDANHSHGQLKLSMNRS